MEIQLAPALEQFVAGMVRSGRYSSASEVVNEAIRLMAAAKTPRPAEAGIASPQPESPEELTARYGSTSAAIRALRELGEDTQTIARRLGIRYQHVRNVLMQPLAASTTTAEEQRAFELFGFRPGSKTNLAATMYMGARGATSEEIIASLGSRFLNLLRQVEARGYRVERTKEPGPDGRQVTRYRIIVNEAGSAGVRSEELKAAERALRERITDFSAEDRLSRDEVHERGR